MREMRRSRLPMTSLPMRRSSSPPCSSSARTHPSPSSLPPHTKVLLSSLLKPSHKFPPKMNLQLTL
jgi:hypothetical protein